MAVLAVRNEQFTIYNCLRHLMRNGIDFAIVDNGSTDATRSIIESVQFKSSVRDIQTVPFDGVFDWEQLLIAQQKLITEHEADWVILLGADEIMHSYRAGETLREAIERLDTAGWNAIDFNEFHFLPIDRPYLPNHNGWQPLRYYYFHEPYSPRLVRARKKTLNVSMLKHAGHLLDGEPVALAPEKLVLRHYVFRDQQHAFHKYPSRVYAPKALARRWSVEMHGKPAEAFVFPDAAELEFLLDPSSTDLNRSRPCLKPYWLWDHRTARGQISDDRGQMTEAR